MSADRFFASPERYARNITEGTKANVIPALLNTPHHTAEDGVALLIENRPILVIPTSDAIRIAHQIADIASARKEHHDDLR